MRQDDVIRALEELGIATSSEIEEFLGCKDGGQISTLERQGLITCLGMVDPISGGQSGRRWRLKV